MNLHDLLRISHDTDWKSDGLFNGEEGCGCSFQDLAPSNAEISGQAAGDCREAQ